MPIFSAWIKWWLVEKIGSSKERFLTSKTMSAVKNSVHKHTLKISANNTSVNDNFFINA